MDFEAGKVAKTYLGHSSKAFTTPMVFVTPVGPYVVAASEDGGLVVWDVNSRQVGGSQQARAGHLMLFLMKSAWERQGLRRCFLVVACRQYFGGRASCRRVPVVCGSSLINLLRRPAECMRHHKTELCIWCEAE